MAPQNIDEEAIFKLARKIASAEDRNECLQQVCGDDTALLARVEALLEVERQEPEFLNVPPSGVAATIDAPSITERPGAVVGNYKLMEQIGEGGMGLVFVAEQQRPIRRKVALKIIKPGMDTKEVIARFEAERQALALMDHPHIAKVLDAGATESGRPYFVMELVKGIPFTEYCDRYKLPTRRRLGLFVTVCQAVQHAHQKGIIHRDLKPTNVLITEHDGEPVVKIIDFGVAKAINQQLTERTIYTRFQQMVGTPMYMSPEQAELSGLDVDTRSDIYSLGVLLYEILTGTTPFDRQRFSEAAYDEIRRIIREEEPPKPSTKISTLGITASDISDHRQTDPRRLSQLLRGELDWIVMRALEKDRGRRYGTANGFAADVERYLNDEPVQACPPSTAYRFKKFARRNKGALATASVVGMALLVIVGVVTGSIGWAVRNRSAIEQQVARDLAARRLVIEQTVNKALEVSAEHMQAKNWQQAIAEVQRAEAALTGEAAPGELRHNIEERLKDLMMVVRLEEIRLEQGTFQEWQFDHAGSNLKYARAFREYGIDLDSLDVETAAERIRGRAVAEELAVAVDHWAFVRRGVAAHDDTSLQHLVAVAKAVDPDPLRNQLRRLLGEDVTEETKNELQQLADSTQLQTLSPTTFCLLSRALTRSGQLEDSIRVLRKAQDFYPSDFWVNFDLGDRLDEVAQVGDEAVRFSSIAVALRPQHWQTRINLGLAFARKGDLEKAIREFEKAVKLRPDRALGHYNLGYSFLEKGDLEKATRELRTVVELEPEHPLAYALLGSVLLRQGNLDEAMSAFDKSIKIHPEDPRSRNLLAWTLATAAEARVRDPDRAVQLAEEACDLKPEWGTYWNTLGVAHYRADNPTEALRTLEKSMDLTVGGTSIDWFFVAMSYWRLGDREEACQWYDKAVAWMAENDPENEELLRFRTEAEETLGLKENSGATAGEESVPGKEVTPAATNDGEPESQPAEEPSDQSDSPTPDRQNKSSRQR